MATTYVGFVHYSLGFPGDDDWAATRRGEQTPEMQAFMQKVRQLPANLPHTCRLVGGWTVNGAPPTGRLTTIPLGSGTTRDVGVRSRRWAKRAIINTSSIWASA